ncbi:MAG: hypothetical protein J0I19_15920 [Alphaproteobacteria bacterium]|nr:hypothetical protein [Alphaproteobacteria bacterium]
MNRRDAREAGHTFYFTGLPCKNDHVAERRTANGVCLKCEAEALANPKPYDQRMIRAGGKAKTRVVEFNVSEETYELTAALKGKMEDTLGRKVSGSCLHRTGLKLLETHLMAANGPRQVMELLRA